MKSLKFVFCGLLVAMTPLWAIPADEQQVPTGTRVYASLDQSVTSNHKTTRVGDLVHARAWRDVVVDGQLVIEAGAPIVMRVSHLQKRRIAGRKGTVELKAISVRAVDGSELQLEGGYTADGKRRIGLAASLGALVVWPAIFIRGKNAELPPGTVIDAWVANSSRVSLRNGSRTRTLVLGTGGTRLNVEVLYDRIPDDGKFDELPMQLTVCNGDWSAEARVDTVNERRVEPLPVRLGSPLPSGDCRSSEAWVRLKDLSDHLLPGINRFTVASGGQQAEVILDVQI